MVATQYLLKMPTYLNHPKVYVQGCSHDPNISVTKCFPKLNMDMLYLIRSDEIEFI